MAANIQKITPFLWFQHQAEEAAKHYTSIFDNSKILRTTHYDAESAAASGQEKGSVMTVAFQLDGQDFVALNGGPMFKFNESISFVINCASQEEVDYYWDKLTRGGDESAQQCGWLKDKYGLSWQVVPVELEELLSHPDPDKAQKAMHAMLQMKKLDIAVMKQAAGIP